jgi:hypothetical protein
LVEQFVLQGELKTTKPIIIVKEMKKAFLTFTVVILLFSVAGAVAKAYDVSSATIPNPSVPEFTVEYLVKAYDVPSTTTSTTDPYTNKTTTYTIPGTHTESAVIEVTIKNQPFPPVLNGNVTNLYYQLSTKGHYEKWVAFDTPSESLPTQSSAENTTITLQSNYPPGGEVDLRVRAVLGYQFDGFLEGHAVPDPTRYFFYATSDWSGTQTITIPKASPSPTAAPSSTQTSIPSPSNSPTSSITPSPSATQQTQPEPAQTNLLLYALVAVSAVVIGLLAGVLITKFRYRSRTPN